MDDTFLQLLVMLFALFVLAFAIPARRRLHKRNSEQAENGYVSSYSPSPSPATRPTQSQTPARHAQSPAAAARATEEESEGEINPLEKFMADHLRRGHHPTVSEVARLQRELEKKNWPIPAGIDIMREFKLRREALAQSKLRRSLEAQGAAVGNEPVQAQATTNTDRATAPVVGSAGKVSDMKAWTLEALCELPDRLTEMLESDPETLEIPVLSDGRGSWYLLKLVAGSHWGFFGVTRSGKGNALQHIALNALGFGPDEIRLIVLDAKGGLDYGFCDKIQHAALFADSNIMDGANLALDEMDRRKALLKAADCRNHYEYEQKTGIRLPLVIIIADEIAEFTDEQHNRIATLARTSGAMGGILMVATQYPVAKVLPTQIQANVGSRLVFRLASSDQIQVAMRRTKEDEGTYNPALITENMKGVAVLRLPGGDELLGRVPEVSDQIRREMIDMLVSIWPKTGERLGVPQQPFPSQKSQVELKSADFSGNTPGERAGNAPLSFEEDEGNAGGTLEIDDEMIAAMLRGGISTRKIMKLLKGKNEKRLERINRIEAQLPKAQAQEGDADDHEK